MLENGLFPSLFLDWKGGNFISAHHIEYAMRFRLIVLVVRKITYINLRKMNCMILHCTWQKNVRNMHIPIEAVEIIVKHVQHVVIAEVD